MPKYIDFADIFSLVLAAELQKHIGINNYTIKLLNGKYPSYRPIYNLRPIESEIVKTYMKTNLANSFIRFFKFPVVALFLFIWKPDYSFHLNVNYQNFNNLTIENWYPLLLINESLDQLS